MKRLALVLFLLLAVAGGVVLMAGPGAQASPDVTITVNRVDDNEARDAHLTLREAMKLATGELSVGDLHEGECHQVSTADWLGWPLDECILLGPPPGVISPDTIVFDTGVFPPGNATISLGSALPTLSTGGDTIDGTSAGVIVDGVSKTFDCFDITSANNTIKGLEIYNCMSGVTIRGGAHSNTVGGSSPGEGNVISGNFHGVDIWDSASGNVVKGNHIGTDATGTAALPNAYGVHISAFAAQNSVGGSTPGERNIISGNSQAGVAMFGRGTNGNTVKGNFIGTDAAGTGALPNGRGVEIYQNPSGGPQNNTIGGTATGEGNVIAYNDWGGVTVYGAAAIGNSIRGNSIHSNHSNGGKGIENDSGGNTELAPPVITGFGSVMGTACPNCTVDIYSDDEDEGRVYEGSTTVNGAGNWSFSGSPEGPNVTATATDSSGNTSEFSLPVAVPEPLDSDSDGFLDAVELYLGTDPLDACPDNPSDDAWPLDMDSSGFLNLGGDVSRYIGRMGCFVAADPSCQRLDFDMSGFINLGGDVSKYIGNMGKTCT
jgi:parallel beta-helix repeat protein